MTPENFVYWLQGYFELNDAINQVASSICSMDPAKVEFIGPQQIKVIKDHLKLVLEKKTPAWIPVSNSRTGITLPHTTGIVDPLYYQHNSPLPLANC